MEKGRELEIGLENAKKMVLAREEMVKTNGNKISELKILLEGKLFELFGKTIKIREE